MQGRKQLLKNLKRIYFKNCQVLTPGLILSVDLSPSLRPETRGECQNWAWQQLPALIFSQLQQETFHVKAHPNNRLRRAAGSVAETEIIKQNDQYILNALLEWYITFNTYISPTATTTDENNNYTIIRG